MPLVSSEIPLVFLSLILEKQHEQVDRTGACGQSNFGHCLMVWSWVSHWTLLCLAFPISKIMICITSTQRGGNTSCKTPWAQSSHWSRLRDPQVLLLTFIFWSSVGSSPVGGSLHYMLWGLWKEWQANLLFAVHICEVLLRSSRAGTYTPYWLKGHVTV